MVLKPEYTGLWGLLDAMSKYSKQLKIAYAEVCSQRNYTL